MQPCLLIKEEIIDENNIRLNKEYLYNSQNMLQSKLMINSNDINYINYILDYKYVTDFPYTALSLAAKKLVDNHIISQPILTSKKKKNKSTNKYQVIDAVTYDYKLVNEIPLVDNLYKLNTPTSVDEGGQDFNSNLEIKETYHNYDNFGNPLYITSNYGDKLTYLWSYKGQYPVAEIKNASYEEVTNALTGTTPEAISALDKPDMTPIDGLRNKLPHALVTTYTYKPLVGMTSMIDPAGVKTIYTYDDFGRLKETLIEENGKQNPVNTYQYHYRTSSEQ